MSISRSRPTNNTCFVEKFLDFPLIFTASIRPEMLDFATRKILSFSFLFEKIFLDCSNILADNRIGSDVTSVFVD
jgi:hypothetical protein